MANLRDLAGLHLHDNAAAGRGQPDREAAIQRFHEEQRQRRVQAANPNPCPAEAEPEQGAACFQPQPVAPPNPRVPNANLGGAVCGLSANNLPDPEKQVYCNQTPKPKCPVGVYKHLGFLFKDKCDRNADERYMYNVFLAKLLVDIKPETKRTVHAVKLALGARGVPVALFSQSVLDDIMRACFETLAEQNDEEFMRTYYDLSVTTWPFPEANANYIFPNLRDFGNFIKDKIAPQCCDIEQAHRLMLARGINFFMPTYYFNVIDDILNGNLGYLNVQKM